MSLKAKFMIGAAIALPVFALGIKSLFFPRTAGEGASAVVSSPVAEEDEAEAKRRQIMREMGRRGGKKSKRGKAKPKTEEEKQNENE